MKELKVSVNVPENCASWSRHEDTPTYTDVHSYMYTHTRAHLHGHIKAETHTHIHAVTHIHTLMHAHMFI